MDIRYKKYTEVNLYLHDSQDFYEQIENFEDYNGIYLDEEFFENISTVTCKISDILRVYDYKEYRQIIISDNDGYTMSLKVIESLKEIKDVINKCSELYNIPIKHIKFYKNNIEIS